MADFQTVRIRPHSGEPFTIHVKGRDRWALKQLAQAGACGVTPRDAPTGPRWSAYVFNLRKLGVPIETLHEPHGEPFPGTHGRYILKATVSGPSMGVVE